jgi:hypothetical protein
MHNRGGLPAALAGALFKKSKTTKTEYRERSKPPKKNSTPYNSNRAAPCPVTITGICGHDAGITGHDQRNTHSQRELHELRIVLLNQRPVDRSSEKRVDPRVATQVSLLGPGSLTSAESNRWRRKK